MFIKVGEVGYLVIHSVNDSWLTSPWVLGLDFVTER